MKNFFVFLLLSLPFFSFAEDWIQINEKGNAILFVDRDSIKVVDQFRVFSTLTVLQKIQYLDKAGPVSEQKSKYIANCKNFRFSLISKQLFDPDKKLTFSSDNPNFKETFKAAPQHSLAYDVVKFACTHRPKRTNL